MELIDFFLTYPALLGELAVKHALLSGLAVVVAVVIAVPIGATVGHLHRFSFLAISGGNILRALPTLAIIAIGIGIYGLGLVNITVALVILAFPLIVTNTYVAVAGVEPGMVEAARGMGMTGSEILFRVELPNSVPLIMSGVRTAWVYVVATAYIGAFAGTTGVTFGDIISDQAQYGLSGVLAATIMTIAVAFVGDALLGLLQRALIPAGLTVRREPALA